MQGNNARKSPFLLASMLSFAVLFLLGVIGFLPIASRGALSYALIAFLTVFLFGLPIGFFVYLRGGRAFSAWNRRSVRKTEVLLAIAASVALIFQNAVLRVIFFKEAYDYRRYTLYGIEFSNEADSAGLMVLFFISLAVLPVFFEEIFFRGILMYEYRHGGFWFSAIFSSLIYAMSALDFSQFPIFFLNGFLLAAVFYLTGNILCSMLSHFCLVFFALFWEKYLFFLAFESETRVLFFFFCGAFWILALIFFCHMAENLLRKRGEKEEAKPNLLPKNKKILALYDILTAPFFGADVLCFAVFAILKIFL